LTITRRRLDQPASPLRVDAPPGSGVSGFWASRLVFPTKGCWSVTGRTQEGALTFIVRVTSEFTRLENLWKQRRELARDFWMS
jgi:hypothetical protein